MQNKMEVAQKRAAAEKRTEAAQKRAKIREWNLNSLEVRLSKAQNGEKNYGKVIAERIKERRLSAHDDFPKGFSQDELARLIHVNRNTVNSWEREKAIPSTEDLLELCRLFDCDITHILGEHPDKRRNVSDVRAETGLSETAAESLIRLCTENEANIDVLNFLFTNEVFSDFINTMIDGAVCKAYFDRPEIQDSKNEIFPPSVAKLAKINPANVGQVHISRIRGLAESLITQCAEQPTKAMLKETIDFFEDNNARLMASLDRLKKYSDEKEKKEA